MFFSRAVSEGNIDYETKHHPLAPVTLFPPLFPTEPAFILFGLAPHVNSLIFKNASFIPRLAVRSPSSILLRKTFQKAGYAIQRTEDDESWTILWGLPKVLTQIRHLAPYQRVNHFPSTYELGRKDRLAIHLRRASRRVGQSHFEFSPLTFILPRDSDILTTYLNSMLPPDPETQSYSEQDDVMDLGEEHDAILEKFPVRFIHKPLASARGIGVRMLNALELLDLGNEAERTFKNAKKCILQEYVASPLLVNGHKVDLRLYVSITSINPLRIYLFKDGLVRFASNPFRSPTESTSRQSKHTKSDKLNEDETSSSDSKFDGEDKQFSHLTNYSVNKARKDQWSLPGNEWMMPARPILFDLKSGTVVEDLPKGLRKYMKPSKRRRLEKKEASAMHKDEDNSSDLSNCVLIGDLDGDGTKWSFMQLLLYCFFVLKCNPFIVVHRIQDVLIKSILSSMPSFQRVSSYLHYDTPCSGTELFGVDILLDCNLRPYILEFNTSPSLQSTSPLDQRLKQAMLVDWLNMVGTPLMGSTARTERGRPSEIRTVESSDGGVEEQVENEINEDDQQVLTEYDTRISPINYTPPRWMSQAEWNSKVKYVVLDVQTENERQTLRSRVDSCRTQSATVPRELHLVGGEREKRGLRQFEATVYTHGSVLLPSHSAGTAEGGDRERQKTRNDVKVDDGGGSCGDVDERTGSGIGRKNRKKADRHLFKTTEVTAIENMTANIEQTRWNTRQRGMNMRSSMHGEGKTRKGSTSPLPQADGIPFFSFSREGRSCAGVSLVDERTLIRSFQSVLPREGEGSAVNPANKSKKLARGSFLVDTFEGDTPSYVRGVFRTVSKRLAVVELAANEADGDVNDKRGIVEWIDCAIRDSNKRTADVTAKTEQDSTSSFVDIADFPITGFTDDGFSIDGADRNDAFTQTQFRGEGQFGRDGKTWMEHRSPGQNMSESWRKDERGTRLPELGSEKKRETGKVDGKEKTKEGKRRVRRKGRVTVNDVADVGVLVLPDYMERFHVSPLCGNRNSLHHEEMGRKDGEGKGEDGYENLVSQEEELKRRRVVFEAGMEFDVVSEEDVISRVERYHGNAETKRERKAMEREKEREQQRGGRRKHDDSDDDGGMLGP
ncbi:putative Tubulin--tyrosine ligase [Blattamonas nauphoetae]|uniref:Tubulin--tyrosine ligase-like protein 5 n=1 Tax=Blattamonas nauphoetae TaxID=2049346 RepID=A0ABQ9XHV0_9EUKA|nr:putative Tubulin--tyrosine ligase [Blattamonas nauphoetae]